jgi:elongation factor 1-alpha
MELNGVEKKLKESIDSNDQPLTAESDPLVKLDPISMIHTKEIEECKDSTKFSMENLYDTQFTKEIKECINDHDINVKFAVAGSVDSGKSTLTGVLKTNKLDDGKGSSRKEVMKWKHELESGRSSDVSYNYIIQPNPKGRTIISLYDLCGHEQYLKTTMFGLTGLFVDYGIVVIGSNMGLTRITKEHVRLLFYLNIPFCVVLTKIDMCPDKKYSETKEEVRKMLNRYSKKPYYHKLDSADKNDEKINELIKFMNKKSIFIPVFSVSNKSGAGIDFFRSFIMSLMPRRIDVLKKNYSTFFIDRVYHVKGIGMVLSGTNFGPDIKKGQEMYIGPSNKLSEWHRFIVRSIHNNVREEINVLPNNSTGCIACKFIGQEKVDRSAIRKGMIVVSNREEAKKNVANIFVADVLILEHSTTIGPGYSAVINLGTVRQTAHILFPKSNKNPIMRSGTKEKVAFKFISTAEWLEVGKKFFFSEGTTRGIGKIISLTLDEEYTAEKMSRETRKDIKKKLESALKLC